MHVTRTRTTVDVAVSTRDRGPLLRCAVTAQRRSAFPLAISWARRVLRSRPAEVRVVSAAGPETARDSSMADLIEHASEGVFVADARAGAPTSTPQSAASSATRVRSSSGSPSPTWFHPKTSLSSRSASGPPRESGVEGEEWLLRRKDGTSSGGGERRGPLRWKGARLLSRHQRAQATDSELRASEDRYRSMCAALPDLSSASTGTFVSSKRSRPILRGWRCLGSRSSARATRGVRRAARPGEFGFSDLSSFGSGPPRPSCAQ